MIKSYLEQLIRGENLSAEQMRSVFERLMAGELADAHIAALLTALACKGPSSDEIAAAASVMREKVTRIPVSVETIDTCGTGGDGSRTFNISTTAALVVAAAGVPVAKHGNRGITSRSGSADVLAALGVNIEADVATVEACLEELGICFCFAPLLHKAMSHVAPVRRKLGVPTIFNILGPLANPAGATLQLLGVGREGLRPLLSKALAMLGTERALVVHGEDGLDEVTLSGTTRVSEIAAGRLREFAWSPADFGLSEIGLESLRVEGPAESAAVVRGVLRGQRGPARDVVIANAAAALWTAGRGPSVLDCARLAADTIDGGRAAELLAGLAQSSRR